MKKLILAALALTASNVFAAEQVVVMEATVPVIYNTNSYAQTNFYMDQQTGLGYVNAYVSESVPRHPQDGGPSYSRTFSNKVQVPGLVLMGDQAVYQGATGNVVCGTMGVSRVFKVPTLFLSGDCVLSSVLMKDGKNSKKLIVTLTTK